MTAKQFCGAIHLFKEHAPAIEQLSPERDLVTYLPIEGEVSGFPEDINQQILHCLFIIPLVVGKFPKSHKRELVGHAYCFLVELLFTKSHLVREADSIRAYVQKAVKNETIKHYGFINYGSRRYFESDKPKQHQLINENDTILAPEDFMKTNRDRIAEAINELSESTASHWQWFRELQATIKKLEDAFEFNDMDAEEFKQLANRVRKNANERRRVA